MNKGGSMKKYAVILAKKGKRLAYVDADTVDVIKGHIFKTEKEAAAYCNGFNDAMEIAESVAKDVFRRQNEKIKKVLNQG